MLTVQVIVEDVVTWIFLKHSVESNFHTSIAAALTSDKFDVQKLL